MRTITVALAVLVLAASAPAAEKEAETLRGLEAAVKALDAAFVKRDEAAIKGLVTADHIATTTYYGTLDLDGQLKALPDTEVTDYKQSDMKLKSLTPDVALVTYRVALAGKFKGKALPTRVLVTGVWVKREGKWREASYQETAIAE
jgi:hypothetical protein